MLPNILFLVLSREWLFEGLRVLITETTFYCGIRNFRETRTKSITTSLRSMTLTNETNKKAVLLVTLPGARCIAA